jgi:hypothetical protein
MPHELRDTFSPIVDEVLRQNMVTREEDDQTSIPVFNTKYEGLPTAGAIKIPKRGKAKVKKYDRANGVVATQGESSFITALVDKDIVVNEIYDSFEVAAADIDVDKAGERVVDAGLSIADEMDSDGLFELVSGGSFVLRETRLTEENIVSVIRALDTKFNKIGVQREGRYLLMSADVHGLLLDAKGYDRALSDVVQAEGYVGKFSSFNIKVTGKLGEATPMIAGHSNHATRARAWAKDPDFFDLDGSDKYVGAVALKGRVVYTHKVTEPEAIVTVKLTLPGGGFQGKNENIGTKTLTWTDLSGPGTAASHAYKIIRKEDFRDYMLEGIVLMKGESYELDSELTFVAELEGSIVGLNVGDSYQVYALDPVGNVLYDVFSNFGM